MRRRGFIAGGGLAVAWPAIGGAQGKTYRVGLVASNTIVPGGVDAFRDELQKLGYAQGKNLVLDVRWPVVSLDREPDLVPAMVRTGYDAIATWGTAASLAAQSATAAAALVVPRGTSAIPVVMIGADDPVGAGLVASLPSPGGNVTGISNNDSELVIKAAELFRQLVSGRIGVIYNAANPSAATQMGALMLAQQQLGFSIQSNEASSAADYDTAFSRYVSSAGVGLPMVRGVFFLPDSSTVQLRQKIADWALSSRMPTMFERRVNVDAGGLMSYGPDEVLEFRQAAAFVDKILKGANPAGLPVVPPEQFQLTINSKTARAIGVTIPSTLLGRAHTVID
jgi:putative ABC transport system substrate-binding protein